MDEQKAIEILFSGDDYDRENFTFYDVVSAVPVDVLQKRCFEIHENNDSLCLIEAIFCWGITSPDERLPIIKHLVENGMDINFGGFKGNTLLHQATRRLDMKCIEYLLTNGADINVLNIGDQTPLSVCVDKRELHLEPESVFFQGEIERISYLLDVGAKLGKTIYDLDNWPDWKLDPQYENLYSRVYSQTPPKWFTLLLEHRKNLAQTITGFLCASRHLKNGNGKDVYRVIAKMIWEKRLPMAPEKE